MLDSLLTYFSALGEIEFIWPWMLAALPLPWLVRRLWKPAEQKHSALLAPHLISRLMQNPQNKSWLQPNLQSNRMPPILLLLWLALILAAMRPVWYLTPTPFEVSGKDMILAVDLSGSMEKNDMVVGAYPVDRLTAVKSVVEQFIIQRQGDRMGLVVFGTQAFLYSPLTYDLNALQILLNEAQIGMAGNNTAIGDAIGITLKHLPQNNPNKPILILLTDGSNTAGSVEPLDAAEKAKKMGLKIYTIGIGQASSASRNPFSALSSRSMDILTLEKIAEITGGQFYLASDTRQLDKIYATIDQLESNPHQVHHFRLRTELYPWPLGLVFGLALFFGWQQLRDAR